LKQSSHGRVFEEDFQKCNWSAKKKHLSDNFSDFMKVLGESQFSDFYRKIFRAGNFCKLKPLFEGLLMAVQKRQFVKGIYHNKN
jgi:hypothetical protein